MYYVFHSKPMSLDPLRYDLMPSQCSIISVLIKKIHKAVLFPFFHEASTFTNLLIPTPYVEVPIDFCFLWKYVKLAMKWVWEKETK